jgi:hypothetical protein
MLGGVSLIVLGANVEPWQGSIAIAALAGVVVFLFRWADARGAKAETTAAAQAKAHAEELGKRDAREAQAEADFETRLGAQAREYAESIRQLHLDNRVHEDAIRKEFTLTVTSISDQTTRSAELLTDVLGKLHDRFSGAKSRQ